MRYYIRHDKRAEVQGPFTVDELADGMRLGKLLPHALASSDINDSIVNLQKWRSFDWFPLACIPELAGLFPPPDTKTLRAPRVTKFTVIFYVLAGVISIYSAVIEQRWFPWLLSLVLILGAVDTVVRYVRQRKHTIQEG